jgi:rsbT co-antagonist protein RsbR
VAQTLVALGLDLADLTPLANLRAALQRCLRQMAKERAASALPASRDVKAAPPPGE